MSRTVVSIGWISLVGVALGVAACGGAGAPAGDPSVSTDGFDLHDTFVGSDLGTEPEAGPDVPAVEDAGAPGEDGADPGPAEDGVEADAADALVPGGKGWPCEDNSECLSGFCIETPDLGNVPCDLTNVYGTCQGRVLCVLGEEFCQGTYALPDVCNGVDDDCDSSTDESNGSCASGSICFQAACRAAPASYCTQELNGGHLYAFCNAGLISWDSADAICLNWGGTQVVINSASELSYVRGKVGGALTWLGYSDKTQEGTWVWEAPGPYIAAQWCSGEPNNATDEDCAQLNWHSDGCWNDCECWLKTSDCTAVYFVCEMS